MTTITARIPEPDFDETVAIVTRLHAGQVDFGGRPYIEHLLGVVANLPPGASEVQRKTALLHDTLEDVVLFRGTPSERKFTADDLRALGFGEDIVAAVVIVTKPDEPDADLSGLSQDQRWQLSEDKYLQGIRTRIIASGNLDAMEVKRADNMHNADPARDQWLTTRAQLARTARLRRRYQMSIVLLDEAISASRAPGLRQGT